MCPFVEKKEKNVEVLHLLEEDLRKSTGRRLKHVSWKTSLGRPLEDVFRTSPGRRLDDVL